MWMRFDGKNGGTTVIQCYAPTECEKDKRKKEKFYEELRDLIQLTAKRYFLVILGDFNARIGTSGDYWGVAGKQGVANPITENGEMLLELCADNNLAITWTFFKHRDDHKMSWYHRESKTRAQIDLIIIRQRWLSSCFDTRVYRGSEFNNTDHRLVLSKIKINLRVNKKRRPPMPNFHKLK